MQGAIAVFKAEPHAPLAPPKACWLLLGEFEDEEKLRKVALDLYWREQLWRPEHFSVQLWVSREIKGVDGEEARIKWSWRPLFRP